MLNGPILFIFWSSRLNHFWCPFWLCTIRSLSFPPGVKWWLEWFRNKESTALFSFPFSTCVLWNNRCSTNFSYTSKSKLCIIPQSASHVAFAFLLLEGMWSSWLPCLPFLLVVFKASTTGGAGCRTCQTGDHGRVECHHRGTWPTRSTSYSVYNQLSFLIKLMA